MQIRTLIFRRYRSQIHYTEVPVGTTGLILILQDLYLFGSPVGVTDFLLIQGLIRDRSTRRYYRANTEVPVGTFRSLLYSFLYSIHYSESYHMSV